MSNYLIVKDTTYNRGVIVDLHVFTTEEQALKELTKFNNTSDVTYRVQKLSKQLTDIEKYHLNKTHTALYNVKPTNYIIGEVEFEKDGTILDVVITIDKSKHHLKLYFENEVLVDKENVFPYKGVDIAFFVVYYHEEDDKYRLVVNYPEVEKEYNEFLEKIANTLKYYNKQSDKVKILEYMNDYGTKEIITLDDLLNEVKVGEPLFTSPRKDLMLNLVKEPENLRTSMYVRNKVVGLGNYLNYLAILEKQHEQAIHAGGRVLSRFNHEYDVVLHNLYKAYKNGLLDTIQPPVITKF